jgi:hypothetical protein
MKRPLDSERHERVKRDGAARFSGETGKACRPRKNVACQSSGAAERYFIDFEDI